MVPEKWYAGCAGAARLSPIFKPVPAAQRPADPVPAVLVVRGLSRTIHDGTKRDSLMIGWIWRYFMLLITAQHALPS